MLSRISEGEKSVRALEKGKILVPKLLAQGFGAKVGDTVVVVATNKDGSVNGKTFLVSGILESATGPGGRDGYINIEDAREILRISGKEVSEIAVSVKSLGQVEEVAQSIRGGLGLGEKKQKGGGIEVHTWAKLSPFSNIARMIDLMTYFHQADAHRHRPDQHSQRHDHGGLRAGAGDRHHRGDRDPAAQDPVAVSGRRAFAWD